MKKRKTQFTPLDGPSAKWIPKYEIQRLKLSHTFKVEHSKCNIAPLKGQGSTFCLIKGYNIENQVQRREGGREGGGEGINHYYSSSALSSAKILLERLVRPLLSSRKRQLDRIVRHGRCSHCYMLCSDTFLFRNRFHCPSMNTGDSESCIDCAFNTLCRLFNLGSISWL